MQFQLQKSINLQSSFNVCPLKLLKPEENSVNKRKIGRFKKDGKQYRRLLP